MDVIVFVKPVLRNSDDPAGEIFGGRQDGEPGGSPGRDAPRH